MSLDCLFLYLNTPGTYIVLLVRAEIMISTMTFTVTFWDNMILYGDPL